ncbi:MAG: hypothetical protein FWG65_11550 [Turicibacter sp.]|nr:hypothetical protein [Turicibacter sp.]
MATKFHMTNGSKQRSDDLETARTALNLQEVEILKHRKLFYLVLVGTAFLLTSCANYTHSFSRDAFPESINVSENTPVRVNIYFQTTSDMANLLETEYDEVVGLLLSNAGFPWNQNIESELRRIYRFDVLWYEMRADDEPYFGRAFAYPLDYNRQGVFDPSPQANQILDHDFYSLAWYERQESRSPERYEQRNILTWGDHDKQHISRTIQEISTFRNDTGEISIMVTNFVPHLYVAEAAAIHEQIMTYFDRNENSSIATFAFENENDDGDAQPFYIIIFGSTGEVVEFSSHFREQLRGINVSENFNIFDPSPALPRYAIRNNSNASVTETNVLGAGLLASSGVIDDEERELFNLYLGEHQIVFDVRRGLLYDSGTIPIHFSVNLEGLPTVLWDAVRDENFEISLDFRVVSESEEHLTNISSGGTTYNHNWNPSDTNILDIDMEIDASIFEGVKRALLVLTVNADLHSQHNGEISANTEFFNTTFSHLLLYVQQARARLTVAEIYIHFILP